MAAQKKEYIVLRFMTRRAEGMKPYKVDSSIKLTNAEAEPLLKNGFVRLKKVQPKKAKKSK